MAQIGKPRRKINVEPLITPRRKSTPTKDPATPKPRRRELVPA